MSGALGADPLAAPIRPMEPVPAPPPPPPPRLPPRGHPLTDPACAFQVKWDGVRMLAFLDGGRVRLQNRRLRERTAAYPELGALASRIDARRAVLDGEVVVLHEGRPSFPRVLQRELAGAPSARLAAALPASFAAFDLLYLDGEDLTGRPFWARQELLSRRVAAEEPPLHVTRNYDDGLSLWGAVVEQGLEGVVAKVRESPYVPGGRSRHWFKVKVRRRVECVLGGYTLMGGGPLPGALLVGLHRDDPGAPAAHPAAPAGHPAASPGRLTYIGRVGSGLDETTRAALAGRLPGLGRADPPFDPPPRLAGLACRWVEPVLTVLVDYAEWTEDLKLRAPSLAGFGRSAPEECRL